MLFTGFQIINIKNILVMKMNIANANETKEASTLHILKRIIYEELPPHKIKLFFACICMIIAAATTAATAGLIKPAIEEIFINKNEELLFILPAIIIAVSILRGASTFGQSLLMSIVGMHVVNNLQKKMYSKLLHLDMAWINKKHSGEIVSSFINDAMAMRDAASNIIVALVKDSLTLIGCAAIMFYQDWLLATITLFIFLPVAIIIKRLMKQSAKSARNIFQETGNLSKYIAETVRGMRILRVYGREHYEAERIANSFNLRLKYILKEVRAKAASSPITEAITGIGMAAAIFYAGSQGIDGQMSLGAFMSFFTAMMMAYQPGRALSGLATKLQMGIVAARRVYDMLDIQIHVKDPKKAETIKNIKGNISFDNVVFDYGNDKNVLNNISLSIKAGEKIGLVGPSGGGKSTLLNLIPRFYDPTSGTISLDNIQIKNCTLNDLRSHISLVSQDAFLFNGTIKENILYGNLDATMDDIITATKQAAAYDFIGSLPKGLETEVGEAGGMLSGGQKQRIAIARAFLKNAPIVLLDEATSALDNESEAHVQQALQSLMKGRTAIIIAHRLSTITGCDRIFVLKDGSIEGEGTHQYLLENNILYKKLYTLSEKGIVN